MNILIDTHILLWWLADDKSLKKKARSQISDIDNLIFVSAATVWEISIKKSLGKLNAPDDLDMVLANNTMESLPIDFVHANLAGRLPKLHVDPFDRMLVAQAKIENLQIMTHDKRISEYDVSVMLV